VRQTESSPKALSFSEFASLSRKASSPKQPSDGLPLRELPGYLTWISTAPDYVFFGQSPFVCPSVPIHKDRIERVIPNASYPCGGKPGQMWSGIIVLKEGSGFDLLTVDRSVLQALPVSSDQELLGYARSFVWFSLETNLRRSPDGWLWGKWSEDMNDTCQGRGLDKPVKISDLVRFGPVGACNDDRIFLAEIPKYSA
jgi:hypothetical protein